MSVYRVLKPVAFTKGDESAMSAMPGATVDIVDDEFAQGLVDAGRIEVFEVTGDGSGEALPPIAEDVDLVDETPSTGKPGESATNPELVEYLVSQGVKRATVANLNKTDLLDAIDRLTHTDDDD